MQLTFHKSVPSKSKAKDSFFRVFSLGLERNSRSLNNKKAPKLGDMKSPFEDVETFYSFWYIFYSWRESLYLNEEAGCHDDRRWIEKQDRATGHQEKKN